MRRVSYWLSLGIIVVSTIGTRWESLWNYVFGGTSPLWRWVVMNLQYLDKEARELGLYPIGIAIGFILLTVTILWPQIWESVTGFERFLDRQKSIYQAHKSKFHMLSIRAYNKWRENHTNLPVKLDMLIDNTGSIDNKQFLSSDISKIESTLSSANKDLWLFCCELYRQIEKSKGNIKYSPTLLSKDECVEFSDTRKKLMDFWDFEGRRIYNFPRITRFWWLKKLEEWHFTDRSLRLLPFLEAALAKEINTNIGAQHLFRLSERAFRKWRAENN